jgi:hypothetical protein
MECRKEPEGVKRFPSDFQYQSLEPLPLATLDSARRG